MTALALLVAVGFAIRLGCWGQESGGVKAWQGSIGRLLWIVLSLVGLFGGAWGLVFELAGLVDFNGSGVLIGLSALSFLYANRRSPFRGK